MTQSADKDLARAFRALSHPRRARIFRLLATNPDAGQSFLHLQATTRICKSSLIHHLREMEMGGLIRRRRTGPTTRYVLATGPLDLAMEQAADLSRRAKHPVRRAA